LLVGTLPVVLLTIGARAVHGAAYVASDLYALNAPAGMNSVNVTGTPLPAAGGQVVGIGQTTGNDTHAVLWTAAGTAVDLNPVGFTNSVAYGANGARQAGYGSSANTAFKNHALVWSGTSASAVDLHPNGFVESFARATNGPQQVGYGYGSATGSAYHALL